MAVIVQCFHCNTILELDEGFRGGVCRCSTCGSLLQVPRAASANAPRARPAAPGAQPTQTSRPRTPGDSGLSRGPFEPEPGSGGSGHRPAIPDFGGSSSGLQSGRRPAAPAATAAQPPRRIERVEPLPGVTHPANHLKQLKKNNMLLVGSLALLGAVAIVALVMGAISISKLEERPATSPSIKEPVATPESPETPVAPAAPRRAVTGFLDVPLVGKKIVISIDGASSMSDNFDYVNAAIYQAVERLGSLQEVQVAIWRDKKVITLPAKFVGKSEIKQLKQKLGMLAVRGSSDAAACMKASLALGADQVIFVTAKPAMDPQIAQSVLAANTAKIRIDCIKLDAEDSPSPMEELARKSGGTFRFMTGTQLQEAIGQ